MGVMQGLASEDVKEPSFDRSGDTETIDVAISNGTRVALSCQGTELFAQITAVERLGAAFVGRVLGFAPAEARPGGLAPGDLVRFRRRDVLWID